MRYKCETTILILTILFMNKIKYHNNGDVAIHVSFPLARLKCFFLQANTFKMPLHLF